jgi:trimeric autotransporter adhesin
LFAFLISKNILYFSAKFTFMKSKVHFLLGIISAFSISAHSQIISTKAGNGISGFAGDGGSAASAKLQAPAGMALGANGNLYFADQYNNRIRMINAAGIISTVAGNDTAGWSGDGGAATAARLHEPAGIALDATGNIYVADVKNSRIRKITTAGVISTIAGTGVAGFSGDNDTATKASLNMPTGVAVDDSGNVYIADRKNNRIRKVNAAGIITTIVGTGAATYNGESFPVNTMVAVNLPSGVAVSPAGELYIADSENDLIRKINKVTGKVQTIKAKAYYFPYYAPEYNFPDYMKLNGPSSITFDRAGNMYIADEYNFVIKKLDSSGTYHKICGTTMGFSGDGGRADAAQVAQVKGIAADAAGNVYFSDWGNNRIRHITTTVSTRNVVTAAAGLSIFPNPASGNFTINVTTAATQKINVVITDVTGKTVYENAAETNKPYSISLQQPAGLYVITVTSDSQIWSEKISIL